MSYITEEQQVEELKSWWKENGKVIIATFILVIGGVLGWRYWQSHQITSRMATSNQYEQVIQAYGQNPQVNAAVLKRIKNPATRYLRYLIRRKVRSDSMI